MTSDFFIEEADAFRSEAWRAIRERPDLSFSVFTKRIDRVSSCLPSDWDGGYPNVTLVCTIENQRQCDHRLPILRDLPALHKQICCEPLLSGIDFGDGFDAIGIERVIVGGESGPAARVCRFDWVLAIREQCRKASVPIFFKQTGYRFEKNGRLFLIPRDKQMSQARRAGLDLPCPDLRRGCRVRMQNRRFGPVRRTRYVEEQKRRQKKRNRMKKSAGFSPYIG